MPTLRSSDVANTSPSDMTGILALLKSQAATFRTMSKKDEECAADNTISLRVPGWAEVHVRNIYPHWNNYMDALRLCNPDNQTWRFDKMDLPPKMLNALKSLMSSRNIHRLVFNNSDDISTGLSHPEGTFDLLLDTLEKNTTVKCVILRASFTLGTELYKAIANHPSLEELHISDMVLVEDGTDEEALYYEDFYTLLVSCKKMKYLSLHHSALGKRGGETIAEFLELSSCSLEHLYLGDTAITDDDVVQISAALQTNNKLCVLSVGGKENNITAVGRKALTKVLFDTSSLDTVANSNHTCRVDVSNNLPPSSDPCPHEDLLDILNCNTCPKDNRRWKVLSVLYATNGMGIEDEFKTYQNLKVIPEVLAFITASFEGEELHTGEDQSTNETSEVHDGDGSEASPAASSIFPSLSSLFSSSNSKKKEEADGDSSDLSVESDHSFDSYDSELEELDDAFEEEEDEVYENFDKSFLDPSFCGERARLTIMFQVVQNWGLPLLNKNPYLAEDPVAAAKDGKQKKKRTTSWKCEPGKKGKKRNKKLRREVVISQKEIDSLAD